MSLSDELAKLQELKSAGALTEEEFQKAKQKLIDHQDAPKTSSPTQTAPPPMPEKPKKPESLTLKPT